MTIADSDVLIEAMRGREPVVALVGEMVANESLATTSVSVFELWSGAKTDREKEKVRRLLTPLTVLSVDGSAAQQAASVRRELEALGKTIGTADYLIAGICLAHGMTLMTFNRKHFERVPGLVLA